MNPSIHQCVCLLTSHPSLCSSPAHTSHWKCWHPIFICLHPPIFIKHLCNAFTCGVYRCVYVCMCVPESFFLRNNTWHFSISLLPEISFRHSSLLLLHQCTHPSFSLASKPYQVSIAACVFSCEPRFRSKHATLFCEHCWHCAAVYLADWQPVFGYTCWLPLGTLLFWGRIFCLCFWRDNGQFIVTETYLTLIKAVVSISATLQFINGMIVLFALCEIPFIDNSFPVAKILFDELIKE